MRKISVLLLLVGMFWIFSTPVHAADWRWVYSNDKIGYYIDASSAYLRTTDHHLFGWEKTIYEDLNERKKIARGLQEAYGGKYDYTDYYYSIVYSEYYVTNKQVYHRSLEAIDYDSRHNVIQSSGDMSSFSKYRMIIPGTVGERIFLSILNCASLR